jgi:large exoprotein involved in heme utilization and adhesion
LTSGQNFTLSDGATVSASSTGTGNSGSISIAAINGDVHVNQGSVTTAATQAEAGNITIAAAQSVNFSNFGSLLSLTLGNGKAGNISIHSENLLLNGGGIFANSGGPNSTGQFVVGTGDAGSIAVEARNMVSLSNNGVISSSTVGNGRGGDIAISAKQLVASTGSGILTDTGSFDVTGPVSGQGQGGRVTVTTQDSVDLNRGQILTRTLGAGDAGDIVVETTQLNISNGGGLFATSGIPDADGNLVTGIGSAGDITVTATESLSLSGVDSFISSATGGAGNGGPISLQTGRLMVAEDAGVIATSGLFDRSGNFIVGQGNAGSITIEAGESASVSNGGFVSSSTGGGVGGVVALRTPELVLSGGSIQARTVGDAPSGSILIQTGDLAMSNGAEMNTGSGLQNNPTGVLLAGKGDGGNISVSASQSINLSTGAQISTESLGEGNAGLVNLTTEGNFQGDDSMISTSAQQAAGGDIIIAAGKDVQLRNNTTVSAESFGTGNAGNISITAADTLLMDKATVTTESTQASGGNIKLTANDTIQLVDSTIESSVQGDVTTAGGDISLDPDFIILQNSQILAKAVQGQGGNITLIANDAVLVDPFSVLDASSALGVSGSVNIQAPIQNLSGTIVPLPQDPVPVTALYGSRCVAGAGGHFSTFVDSKADSLAPTPGAFLASPFLPLSNLSRVGALGHAETRPEVSENRHAAPPQVSAYSPPVLFAQGDEMLTACP